MSCLPGTPCYTSTIHTTGGLTGGCNIDPCITLKLSSDSVLYTGPNLPCSGINPCDNMSLALQKIDAVICNPPALSVTADNGLTKTANNIQLGGPLIQQTVITTSHANTFSLLGLDDDLTPTYVLSQTSGGVTKRTTIASIISTIIVNNGLTNTAGTLQLSGPLIKPTTVTTDVTNTLSLAGLQADANPDFIVTETTAGVVRRISTSALATLIVPPPVVITADNGLTKTVNNIQLGGPLLKNTSIDLATYNLTLSDSTSPQKLSKITLGVKTLDVYSEYTQIGNNSIPLQKFGTAIGRANSLLGTGQNGFAAGVANTIYTGSSSYAIGESNSIYTSQCGALGYAQIVRGSYCHSIGYDNETPIGALGTFQVGIFNDSTAVDYITKFSDPGLPAFSVAHGKQSGNNPAERLNVFHVMTNGLVKSKDGHDARAGERGIVPAHWSTTGWTDTVVRTFDTGAKYIIMQIVAGDDFSNIVDEVLWGSTNKTGFTFISIGGFPTTWTNGSTVRKVGRPGTPAIGELGFNLDLSQMEYWNGSAWTQF